MDLVAFGEALGRLTIDDIRALAADLDAARGSPAEEIAATRAVLMVEHALHHTRRSHHGAAAALAVITAVQAAARHSHVSLPDDDVTHVARAAARLARALVAGDNPPLCDALRCLARGWQRLPCTADLVSA